MKTVIYIDELLVVNFAIAAAFLLAAGLLAGLRCTGGRLVAAACCAAASSLILLAPELPFAAALAYRAATGGGAVLICFGWPGAHSFVRVCGWYLTLNLLLAGVVCLRALPGTHSANLAVYLDVAPGMVLVCTALVYMAAQLLMRGLGRTGQPIVPATLEIAGRHLAVRAFYDTGFAVRDPLAARPVVMAQYEKLRAELPETLQTGLDAAFNGGVPDSALRLRFLLCSTVAGQRLMPALPAEALSCCRDGRERRVEGLLVAFCRGGGEEEWSLLFGADTAALLGL